MNKTAKIVTGVVVGIVVIGAAAAGVVLGRLDRIIERGVETAGPRITGTDVDLGSADVSIFSGAGELNELSIENPEGYSDGEAFDLGRIAVQVDIASLTGDVVRVKSVVIDGPELLAEFNEAGRNNLSTILDHVKGAARGGGGGGEKPAAGDNTESTKLIVEEFRFENAKLRALAPAFKVDKSLELPPIVLKNLGTAQGGLTPSQLANQMLRPVIDKAVQAAMKETVAERRGELEEKAKQKLFEKLQ